MGRIPTILITVVLATVFGFVGALGAILGFQDTFRGEQGASGLVGAPGEPGLAGGDGADGRDGKDGKDGADGKRGKEGSRGKQPKAAEPSTVDLGTEECSGASVPVVADVTIENERIRLTKVPLCVTGQE